MKIALVFGKGLDGCGVEKYASVLKNVLKDQLTIYSLKEKSFTRSGAHVKEYKDFTPEQMSETAKELNEYDIVIYNSYPGTSNKPSTIKSFFFDLVQKVTKPITVGMMHEIKKANYERIPMHVAIANEVDQMYNFSTHSDYAKAISSILKHKTNRIRKFRMPMTINYNSVPFEEKNNQVIYAGRWTTMKGPRRLMDFMNVEQDQFKARLIGIERSIGAKCDIIDHPKCVYAANTKNYDKDVSDYTVFGPYEYSEGQKIMAEALFGYSGFTLPKEPQNYGDRMEYSQMEIFINGTIPIFDKHFGENNTDSTGKRYIDNDKIALWSSKSDLSDVYDQMVEITKNPDLYKEYINNGKKFIHNEVDANIVVPAFIEEILEIGKDENKISFEELINSTHGSHSFEKFIEMRDQFPDNACTFNVKDCVHNEMSYYIKKKRIIHKFEKETLDEW